MATITETPEATNTQKRFHQFHAEAHVLSGELQRPIKQKIEPHVPVKLTDERGGHLTRFTEDVSIEGLIAFKSGHSRVSGSKSLKNHGWVTLSTSILEGLNVFEVITADRLVAQVSTEHPEKGHVPDVTFLGTKFENLQVNGFPLRLNLNLGFCGKKPDGDKSYVEDSKFLMNVREQVASIAHAKFLPEKVKDEYDKRLAEVERLINRNGGGKGHDEPVKVTCSLVKSIAIDDIPIPGLRTVGNVLVIPDFGAVSLAEVEVGVEPAQDSATEHGRNRLKASVSSNGGKREMSDYFTLRMLNMELGCIGTGSVSAATTKSNGTTYP